MKNKQIKIFSTRKWVDKGNVFMILNPEEGPMLVIKP